MMDLVLAQGTRIVVRHGDGEALASVQRFVVDARTMKVRKWRKSKKMWSGILTIPTDDFLKLAPYEMYMDAPQETENDTD